MRCTVNTSAAERRNSPRERWDDVIRWKRPGRPEDHRGWALDYSERGIGFMASAMTAPAVGDSIHVRRFDGDRWATIEQHIRVARTAPTTHPDMLVIGCELA